MNIKWAQLVVGLVLGAIAGVVVLRAIPSDAAGTNVEWQFPGGSLKMDVKKDLNDPEAMFKKLFQTDFSREGTLGLLRGKKIFSIQDHELVESLKAACPNKGSATETPVELQARLEKCLDISVVRELRQLADDHAPPFQYIGKRIDVGIPQADENKPPDGHANVCRNRGLLGKTVQLINPSNRKQIMVEATGSYLCTGLAEFPELQLNERDAAKLFNRATMKKEVLIAVVVSS